MPAVRLDGYIYTLSLVEYVELTLGYSRVSAVGIGRYRCISILVPQHP